MASDPAPSPVYASAPPPRNVEERRPLPSESRAMAPTPSALPPPRNVEKTRALPEGSSFATKASWFPLYEVSYDPGREGKFTDCVWPATYALPDESTVIAYPSSTTTPPRKGGET